MAARHSYLSSSLCRQLSRNWGTQWQRRRISTTAPRTVTVAQDGIEVSYEHARPGQKRSLLLNIWLRDNCRCTNCVNQDTLQRNLATFSIPRKVEPLKIASDQDGLHITWSDSNHESWYPWDFISFYQQNDYQPSEPLEQRFWGKELALDPPTVTFSEAQTEAGVGDLTRKLRETGVVFVAGTPYSTAEPTRQLLERIAFLRDTHYGAFYDFKPDLAMADTAYTNLALPAHTDTTYFSEPAGLQSFHLLEHTPPPPAAKKNDGGDDGASQDNMGGKSLLVDGFRAAAVLAAHDPRAFEVLRKVRLPWHASGNQGINIRPDRRYPVFETVEVEADDAGTGDAVCVDDAETGKRLRLHRVRWNNDDRGVVPLGGVEAAGIHAAEWYDAARKWDAVLRRDEAQCWIQLVPGSPLIFDNWRVLHGRSAFEGVRRMCGGYINRDDFVSRYRNTNFPRSEVLKQVTG